MTTGIDLTCPDCGKPSSQHWREDGKGNVYQYCEARDNDSLFFSTALPAPESKGFVAFSPSPLFVAWVRDQMKARYASGIPVFVRSYIEGEIYALAAHNLITSEERETLFDENDARLREAMAGGLTLEEQVEKARQSGEI